MTRTTARELAVNLIFAASASREEPELLLDTFFEESHYQTLFDEHNRFGEYPDPQQLEYIRALVIGVHQKREELDDYIQKYARGWKVSRISRTAVAVLRCAIYEILYVEDVPQGAAINEAVELAKNYDDPETVAFINGVLGSFVREECTQ